MLLRGINVGSHKRIAMPALRELLGGAGYGSVRTYLQSGNIVLDSAQAPERLARECEQRIAAQFGFEVQVIVRTRDELERVVSRNPLREVALDPKRYQVSFMAAEPDPAAIAKLTALVTAPERFELIGRELYTWHPAGIARSRLWARIAAEQGLGVPATARNWTTVRSLLAIADR